jgi:hypothetical protein
MKKAGVAGILFLYASYAVADPVVDAYDSAYASGRVALSMQKACEASVQKGDFKPCEKAKKAYAIYQERSMNFLASVKPAELFQHVTPQQMDVLVDLNKEIGRSLDYVDAYFDVR